MKTLLLLLTLLAPVCISAQDNNNIFFDPERNPVALRSDSTLQLLVSEYVLIKSLKTRLGQDCQVLKTYERRMSNGAESLVFEGVYLAKNRQRFTLSIPLTPDTQQKYYFTSAQAIVCSAPGCNNCSIDHGNCIGCCATGSVDSFALPSPLSKVSLTIDK